MRHRAILIAESCWVTARTIHAWMKSGQEIAEIWCFDDPTRQRLEAPATLSEKFMPGWNTAALVRANRIPVRLCPGLKTWTGAGSVADGAGADVLMTVMTNQIVPGFLLRHFDGRAINVHPALLPHYKGPSPRAAMLMDGTADRYGGITFHVLTERIDEGAIVGQRWIPFSAAGEYALWDAMQAEAAAAIVEAELLSFLAGKTEARRQEPGTGNYRRIGPGEFRVSANDTADRVRRLCEALGSSGWLLWKPEKDGTGKPGTFFIRGFAGEIGRPQALPPRVSALHIEMDVRDARIRLRRRRKVDRLLHSLRVIGYARAARRAKYSWPGTNSADASCS